MSTFTATVENVFHEVTSLVEASGAVCKLIDQCGEAPEGVALALENILEKIQSAINRLDPVKIPKEAVIDKPLPTDISCELAKINSLADKLAKDLFEKSNVMAEDSEERGELEALYWIADTIRGTGEKVYSDLYTE